MGALGRFFYRFKKLWSDHLIAIARFCLCDNVCQEVECNFFTVVPFRGCVLLAGRLPITGPAFDEEQGIRREEPIGNYWFYLIFRGYESAGPGMQKDGAVRLGNLGRAD
jgi:hypothetical protein